MRATCEIASGGQAVRIAGAVHPLVMMQAHVHRLRVGPSCLGQQGVPARGMRLHHVEFFGLELARLVQDRERHDGLADVVQQARHAGAAAGVLVVPEFATQRDHQGAHGHRVHVGIVVLRLQAGQAHERARIAEDRVGDVVHEGQAGLGVDDLAEPGLREQAVDLGAASVADVGGRAQLFVEGDLAPTRAAAWGRVVRGGSGKTGSGTAASACGSGDDHDRRRHAQRPARVTSSPLSGSIQTSRIGLLLQQRELLRLAQDEMRLPERMVEPGALECMQVHAQADVGDKDLLEHRRPAGTPGEPGQNSGFRRWKTPA